MKIAELQGEKTVPALAKRLLQDSSAKIPVKELAETLLRLNPLLSQIGQLAKGTPILLPPELAAPGEDGGARAALAAGLARQAEAALQDLRAALRTNAPQAGDEAEQAQVWLKGESAKEILREVPELKEEFSKTAVAAGKVRKEQAALLAVQEKLLQKLQDELAAFQKSPSQT